MSKAQGTIEALVTEAMSAGYAVSRERIAELRAQSEKEISLLKRIFWVVLGLFNLIVWNPMSITMPATMRWGGGFGVPRRCGRFPYYRYSPPSQLSLSTRRLLPIPQTAKCR